MPSAGTRAVFTALLVVAAFSGCLEVASDGDDTFDDTGAAETDPDDDGSENGTDANDTDPEAAALERAASNDSVIAATFREPAAETTVSLEIADAPDERAEGLMNRTSLPENHGMVFVYPGEDLRSFWMVNTYVPLDMIFLDADRTVVDVEHADPQPDADPEVDEVEIYEGDEPAQYVIELERGFANETGVEPGVEVEFDEDLETDA